MLHSPPVPEDWIFTVKFTLVGVPAITLAGLALTVDPGNGAVAATVVVLPV